MNLEEAKSSYMSYMEELSKLSPSNLQVLNSEQYIQLSEDLLRLNQKILFTVNSFGEETAKLCSIAESEEGKSYFIRSLQTLGEKATADARGKFKKNDDAYLNASLNAELAKSLQESYRNLLNLVDKYYWHFREGAKIRGEAK